MPEKKNHEYGSSSTKETYHTACCDVTSQTDCIWLTHLIEYKLDGYCSYGLKI